MMVSTTPWRSERKSTSSVTQREAAGRQPRKIEQFIDKAHLPGGILLNRTNRSFGRRRVEGALLEHGRPPEHGAERGAQLVRHEGDELVFQPVRGFCFGTRRLRRFVEAGAFERLGAVLRDRNQERAVFLVEVHRAR